MKAETTKPLTDLWLPLLGLRGLSAVGGPVDDDLAGPPGGPCCPADGSLLKVSELDPREAAAEEPGPSRIGLTEPLFLQEKIVIFSVSTISHATSIRSRGCVNPTPDNQMK